MIEEPFLLLTYTDGLGEVPPIVQRFMDKNGEYCRGVAVSGNRNFGHHNFGRAGDTVGGAMEYSAGEKDRAARISFRIMKRSGDFTGNK